MRPVSSSQPTQAMRCVTVFEVNTSSSPYPVAQAYDPHNESYDIDLRYLPPGTPRIPNVGDSYYVQNNLGKWRIAATYNSNPVPYAPGGAIQSLISRTVYNPSVAANWGEAPSTDTAIDTQNLTISFALVDTQTALIRLQALTQSPCPCPPYCPTPASLRWGLIQGGTIVVPSEIVSANPYVTTISRDFFVGNIPYGTIQTLDWSWAANNPTGAAIMFAGGNTAAAIMEVWSVADVVANV